MVFDIMSNSSKSDILGIGLSLPTNRCVALNFHIMFLCRIEVGEFRLTGIPFSAEVNVMFEAKDGDGCFLWDFASVTVMRLLVDVGCPLKRILNWIYSSSFLQ